MRGPSTTKLLQTLFVAMASTPVVLATNATNATDAPTGAPTADPGDR